MYWNNIARAQCSRPTEFFGIFMRRTYLTPPPFLLQLMPANAALNRLLTYYQSQQFADDLVRQLGENPVQAKIYRQHIIDRLNACLQIDGITLPDVILQEQERFVCAAMSNADLVVQARLYVSQWASCPHHG